MARSVPENTIGCFLAVSINAAILVCLTGCAERVPPIPDFSGLWGRNSLDFEPPPSGPGPILNLARQKNVATGSDEFVGDHTNPVLTPQAAEIVRTRGEISLSGVAAPSPRNQCQPESPPYILGQLEMRMLQQKEKITILYRDNSHVRHVRLDDSHPAHVTPSWSGDSVGHYEGDTLVVDTVGIKVGPLAMVDQYGTPYSEALHVVERYRLIDGEAAKAAIERNARENGSVPVAGSGIVLDPDYSKGLQVQFTVEDEGVFTMPWSAAVTYQRASGEMAEYICAENTREYYANKDTEVPVDDAPDF